MFNLSSWSAHYVYNFKVRIAFLEWLTIFTAHIYHILISFRKED